jgi:hypothetical protein
MYEQKPVPVWVLILIILGGGWLGGAGLIFVFDKVSSASAAAPNDAELLRRMKEIERQHASIESKQEVMIDEMKAQASDPTSIAKLQEQYVSLSERVDWVLKGLGIAFLGGAGWATKQIRMANAATKQLKALLGHFQLPEDGGGNLGIEPHGHSGTDAS